MLILQPNKLSPQPSCLFFGASKLILPHLLLLLICSKPTTRPASCYNTNSRAFRERLLRPLAVFKLLQLLRPLVLLQSFALQWLQLISIFSLAVSSITSSTGKSLGGLACYVRSDFGPNAQLWPEAKSDKTGFLENAGGARFLRHSTKLRTEGWYLDATWDLRCMLKDRTELCVFVAMRWVVAHCISSSVNASWSNLPTYLCNYVNSRQGIP